MKIMKMTMGAVMVFVLQANADAEATNVISNTNVVPVNGTNGVSISKDPIALGQTTPHSVIARTNTLAIQVGVVMKNGDIKPIARTDFFLCPESLDSILSSELKAHPTTTAEDFCKTREFSPELMNHLKSLDFDLWKFSCSIKIEHAAIPLETIRQIPELSKAFNKNLEGTLKYSGLKGSKAIESAYHQLYDAYLPKSVNNAFDDYQALKENELKLNHLNAELRAKSLAIAKSKTDFSGKATFVVPTGIYWLTNIKGSPIGNSVILWDYKISIANDISNLEISNDNAYRISDSEN